MSESVRSVVVPLLVALIAAGVGSYLRSGLKALYARLTRTPEEAEARQVRLELENEDKSALMLKRDYQELADRNRALYAELEATDARHARERQQWEAREAHLVARAADLERRLREVLDELVELRQEAQRLHDRRP